MKMNEDVRITDMKLGLNLGYWSKNNGKAQLGLAQKAEELGYSCVWVAEAYGSDCVSILSWLAAHTSTIGIGSAIMQIPARTPAMTAMTAMTLDTLSNGRFHLGLGVSGPQVSEGWHGVRFAKPLQRTKEYIAIINQIFKGERVSYNGEFYQLPLPGGEGKSIKPSFTADRDDIPIYLASIGPKNLELTGEICQGWLGVLPTAQSIAENKILLEKGAKKAGRTLENFDIAPTIAAAFHENWEIAADATRAYTALYVGGMGSKKNNFYNAHIRSLGYGDIADTVQNKYLARDYAGAMAALPAELLNDLALLGTPERMAEQLRALSDAGVTTCNIAIMPDVDPIGTLNAVAQAYAIAKLT